MTTEALGTLWTLSIGVSKITNSIPVCSAICWGDQRSPHKWILVWKFHMWETQYCRECVRVRPLSWRWYIKSLLTVHRRHWCFTSLRIMAKNSCLSFNKSINILFEGICYPGRPCLFGTHCLFSHFDRHDFCDCWKICDDWCNWHARAFWSKPNSNGAYLELQCKSETLQRTDIANV